mmetsp:Transcript_85481/g.151211  ORF Transcript_85481/g.151211 Transcript_85481/m.151211 type:complete len:557 (+) Transcript_85481:72-1742(+)
MAVGPSLEEVANAKLREARRLVRLERSYDAEKVAEDAKVLFEKLHDTQGSLACLRILVNVALLEERLEEAAALIDGQSAAGEESLLLALAEVRLAEGSPRQALETAKEAEALLLALGDKKLGAELLLLVSEANLLDGNAEASLNAALQALDLCVQTADERGEGDSWRSVMKARLAMGDYEDSLRAAEAVLVTCMSCNDEAGQALALLDLAKAHLSFGHPRKSVKASEKALGLFKLQGSDVLAAHALEILTKALMEEKQFKEALKRIREELSSSLGAGDKRALPRLRFSLCRIYLALQKKKEALAEAEQGLAVAEELGSMKLQAEGLQQVAMLNLHLGSARLASELAERALPLFRRLGDMIGEATVLEIIAQAMKFAAQFEDEAAKEREALEIIEALKRSLESRNAKDFKDLLQICYENEYVMTQDVEEVLGPVIAEDPEGVYDFVQRNQPEKYRIDEADRPEREAAQFDRRLLYYMFRWGAMGYGPGFRLLKTAHRVGTDLHGNCVGVGTLNLMDDCPDWEEKAQWHPGILDCTLQVNVFRHLDKSVQQTSFAEPS